MTNSLNDSWIKVSDRFVKTAAISAIKYDDKRFEVRIYELNGYTSICAMGPKEFNNLAKILNIQEGSPLVLIEIGV